MYNGRGDREQPSPCRFLSLSRKDQELDTLGDTKNGTWIYEELRRIIMFKYFVMLASLKGGGTPFGY